MDIESGNTGCRYWREKGGGVVAALKPRSRTVSARRLSV